MNVGRTLKNGATGSLHPEPVTLSLENMCASAELSDSMTFLSLFAVSLCIACNMHLAGLMLIQ